MITIKKLFIILFLTISVNFVYSQIGYYEVFYTQKMGGLPPFKFLLNTNNDKSFYIINNNIEELIAVQVDNDDVNTIKPKHKTDSNQLKDAASRRNLDYSMAFVFKNLKSNNLYTLCQDAFYFSNNYLLDSVPNFNWKYLDSQKVISNQICNLALASWKGRTYHAWYSKNIKISNGPLKFGGLPGLILEIRDINNEFYISCERLRFNKNEFNFDFPKVTISNDEYLKNYFAGIKKHITKNWSIDLIEAKKCVNCENLKIFRDPYYNVVEKSLIIEAIKSTK